MKRIIPWIVAAAAAAVAFPAGAQPAPSVRLKSAGEEPRVRFALAPETGATFEARVEFDASRETSSRPRQSVEGLEAADQHFVQTPVRLVEEIRVVEAKPDAPSRVVRKIVAAELRVSGGELSPDDAALATVLNKLPGREFNLDVRPDGAVRARDSLRYEETLGIGLRWLPMAEAAAPVFPAEAIGVGAKWEVEREIALEGISVPTTIAYEAKSVAEDGTLELEFEMRGSAPPQPFDLGANAGGAEATTSEFELRGEGSCASHPGRPIPVALRVAASVEAKLALKVPVPQPTAEIDHLDFDVDVEMKARYSLDSTKTTAAPPPADPPADGGDADGVEADDAAAEGEAAGAPDA